VYETGDNSIFSPRAIPPSWQLLRCASFPVLQSTDVSVRGNREASATITSTQRGNVSVRRECYMAAVYNPMLQEYTSIKLKHPTQGPGTFCEEGGEEMHRRDSPYFLLCPPYFWVCPPWIECLGGQTRIAAHPSYKIWDSQCHQQGAVVQLPLAGAFTSASCAWSQIMSNCGQGNWFVQIGLL